MKATLGGKKRKNMNDCLPFCSIQHCNVFSSYNIMQGDPQFGRILYIANYLCF